MTYDSTQDTIQHIERVVQYLGIVIEELQARGMRHDQSKLKPPEKEIFDAVTPKLAGLTYGSDEYKAALVEMGEALRHHYRHNRHHPEHFPGGVTDMSLIDMLEMLCDWKAASERHGNGDMAESLNINAKRFGIERQLGVILANTAQDLGWIDHR